MPSFDIISEIDKHELTNALDTANRELGTRFDFKGSDASFDVDGFVITQRAPSDFQLKQMLDILRARLIARGIDIRCMEVQKVTIKQGIEQKLAKKIVGIIKDAKLKVEAQINGEKLRVTAKKRDDLQDVMALLKKSNIELPLQFENFRD